MPCPKKFLSLSKKILLLGMVFAALRNDALAQVTKRVRESPDVISTQNEVEIWYFAILILGGIFFCASIFWWRRDKSKDESSTPKASSNKDKIKDSNLRKPRVQESKHPQNQDEDMVNANLANWIQNNIGNKKSTSSQYQDRFKTQHNILVTRAQTIDLFRLPAPLPPIKPLPTLTDESLSEAIEQVQNFDAAEEQREVALNIILAFKSRNAVEALTQVAHYDESSKLRIVALSGLGEFDHESVFEPVLLTCTDPAREVKAAAARTLARLSVNRAEAYARIVESEDPERLRLASMACIDAGLATHALARLAHYDNQQANDAFAMVRLLAAAEQFTTLTKAISHSHDIASSLIMIKALKAIKPIKMLPALSELLANFPLSIEVKTALKELVAELSEV